MIATNTQKTAYLTSKIETLFIAALAMFIANCMMVLA